MTHLLKTICLLFISYSCFAQTTNDANFKTANVFPNGKKNYKNASLSFSYDANWKISKRGDNPEYDEELTWQDSIWNTSTWDDYIPGSMLTIKPKDNKGYIWLVTGNTSMSYNDIFSTLINVNYYSNDAPKEGLKIISGETTLNGQIVKQLEVIYAPDDPTDVMHNMRELWFVIIKDQTYYILYASIPTGGSKRDIALSTFNSLLFK